MSDSIKKQALIKWCRQEIENCEFYHGEAIKNAPKLVAPHFEERIAKFQLMLEILGEPPPLIERTDWSLVSTDKLIGTLDLIRHNIQTDGDYQSSRVIAEAGNRLANKESAPTKDGAREGL